MVGVFDFLGSGRGQCRGGLCQGDERRGGQKQGEGKGFQVGNSLCRRELCCAAQIYSEVRRIDSENPDDHSYSRMTRMIADGISPDPHSLHRRRIGIVAYPFNA